MRRAFGALAVGILVACSAGRQIVARDDDLAAYRAFRAAAHPGTRLARAQRYVEQHADGAWVDEVKAAFEREEPRWFDAAKTSRSAAREYLVDLPRGPHADAALALLVEHDTKTDDIEVARLLRDARRTEAVLERAATQRRAVGERVVGWLATLLDPAIYGRSVAEAPAAVLAALDGPAARTWGAAPKRRSEDVFFSVPGVRERESRVAVVVLELETRGDAVARGSIGGRDLFVRWHEADAVRPIDGASPDARAAAARHVAEVLGGALEAKLPGARCTRGADAVLARACGGLGVIVTMGRAQGDRDAVVVGPEGVVLEVGPPPR